MAEEQPFVVIAGYGLPGRSLADRLTSLGVDFHVVELNAQTVERVALCGINIKQGDAADPLVLKDAGVERATLVALMVPNDEVVLQAVTNVRQYNASVPIIARCAYTSTGLEAMRRGATKTIVAEQIVARELGAMADKFFANVDPHRHV